MFETLARDLSTWCAVPWRRHVVDGASSFDLERLHLRVDEHVVELQIEVDPATFRAFA